MLTLFKLISRITGLHLAPPTTPRLTCPPRSPPCISSQSIQNLPALAAKVEKLRTVLSRDAMSKFQ